MLRGRSLWSGDFSSPKGCVAARAPPAAHPVFERLEHVVPGWLRGALAVLDVPTLGTRVCRCHRGQPRVAGRSWSGQQLLPFRLPAPGSADGLHKAGNVSKGLRWMAFHPRLSLKTLSLKTLPAGLARSGSGSWQPAAFQPRGAAGEEAPGSRDVAVVPGMHSPEKSLLPCWQGAPQSLSVPSSLF